MKGFLVIVTLAFAFAFCGLAAAGERLGGRSQRLGTPLGARSRWPGRAPVAGPYVDPDRGFLLATPSGVGMGTECGCDSVTSVKGDAFTNTRAGNVWCSKADFTGVECGANKLRVMSDRGTPAYLGVLVEGRAATNIVTNNRDLTAVEWVKVNGTAAKTAAGWDGVSNAASTFTATSTNATVLQTTSIASASRNSSLYIKRRTGTGVVSVTRDGSTYTAITSSLSTSIFKRVVSLEEIGCRYGGCIQVSAMTATAASPIIGVKLATSGDAVDIDLVQDEAGSFPSSPITTGTLVAGAVTRPAEAPYVDPATPFTPQVITWDLSRTGFGPGSDFVFSLYTDASNRIVPLDDRGYSVLEVVGGNTCYWITAGSIQAEVPAFFVPVLGPVPMRCANNTVLTTSSVNGGGTSAATTVNPPPITRVYVGGPGGTAGNELLTNVCADAVAANCALNTNRAPSPVVWIGDSIIAANNPATAGVMPSGELGKLIGRTSYNWAIAGTACASAQSVYQTSVKGRGFHTLIVSCGTNDVAGSGGTTTAAVIATLTALYDEVRADGLTLIATNILPRGNSAGWTPGMQTSLEAINAFEASYCLAHSLNCVDGYTAFGGQGGDPTMPLDAEFASDHVHLNTVGSAHYATLAAAANP